MTRIVIMGGGPAGYEAALVAAQHGAEVTVVEIASRRDNSPLDMILPLDSFNAFFGTLITTNLR